MRRRWWRSCAREEGEKSGARAVGVVEVDAHACGGCGRLERRFGELPRAAEKGGGGERARKKVGEKMTGERRISIQRRGGSEVAWAIGGRLIPIRR